MHCRVDELQQQEAAVRVAMDMASSDKHKVHATDPFTLMQLA